VTILMGKTVNWGTQKRGADGTDWIYAIRRHWGHTLLGIVWGGAIWWTDSPVFWWFLPLAAGMTLAVPLSVLTSRGELGARFHDAGLFLTPEETNPPAEIISLRDHMTMRQLRGEFAPKPAHSGLADAVLDPYVNAIHVTLLREKKLNPHYTEALAKLGVGTPEVRRLAEKLLGDGPDKLTQAETMLVLSDEAEMLWLHHQAWLRPPEQLAAWWQPAIRQYAQ